MRLRILATSDLHAHILPWDDLSDQPAPDRGLAQIASLVAVARAEVAGSLLLDNGDFLNGSPLADHVAETRLPDAAHPHPMIAAMNRLGYDAATLGNHEFSNGLALLTRSLAQAEFAVLATNLDRVAHKTRRRRAFLLRHVLVRRHLTDQTGQTHVVTIGILGFLPPQTALWERRHLAQGFATRGILAAAKAALPRLRRAGADLVVALSHSGLGATAVAEAEAENISLALAALPGIDAVIAGHTHQVFPTPCPTMRPPLRAATTALGGDTPLVMPGFYGSHLGVIDLDLAHGAAGWRVIGHQVGLRPVAERLGPLGQIRALTTTDGGIAETVARDTAAMHRRAGMAVGHSDVALHSHFALIGHSPVQTLLAEAQARNMRHLLQTLEKAGPKTGGAALSDLPMLVSVAPFKAGGRSGPANYTDIPAGPLTARHIADLYIHPNSPVALLIKGRDLANWLERSVSLFHQILPGAKDAPLIDPAFPAYNFEMIHGLTYRIDLSQPARFDAQGRLIHPSAQRIRDLCHGGQSVPPDQDFVLVTNSYRAAGGAGFVGTDPAHVVMEESRPLRRIVQDHVAAVGRLAPAQAAGWGFVPMPGTSALFDSGPGAAAHSAGIAGLETVGMQPTGFLRFRLRL